MNRIWKIGAGVALALVAATASAAIESTAGPYRLSLETEPRIVALGNVKLNLTVRDAAGTALDGLDVRMIARMPGMSMGEREALARAVPGKPGLYEAAQPFAMEGGWEVSVRLKGPKGEASTTIPLRTGQDTHIGKKGFSLLEWIPWAVGLAFVLFLVLRLRATGQRVSWASVLNRASLAGFSLLSILLLASIWAVNNLRRPGSMTPLEAQGMAMETPPPPGVVPATLAQVEFGEVAASVSYSGQAVGFVEQDVVPRVSGTIVSMPVYVGDRVIKGQVVARLDTSQLDPEVAEKAAMADAAARGVDVAQSEYRTALQEIAEARADLAVRQAAVEEAEANRSASQQEKAALMESVNVAEAKVEDARAEIESAQKSSDYWSAELKRARELYEKGVIARSNLQRTEADAARAETELHHAYQQLRQSQAEVSAARANVSRADAMIVAAGKRVVQAQADVRAAQATLKAREAAADSRRKGISKEQAAVAQAQAGYRGAATLRGYTELRSETDGVVSKRFISPGTVVGPGQAILQIARIRPIRLQANVSEVELGRIRVGTPVEVGSGPNAVRLTVSSVSPSVDPSSRTAVVEVLYENRDERFSPGQFVSMRFRIGAPTRSLRVPSAALRPAEDAGEGRAALWLAEPGASSKEWTVRQVVVEVVAQDREFAAVRSSELRQGQNVVVQGNAHLRNGDSIAAAPRGKTPEGPMVEVSAAGFSPATIEVEAGRPTTITFTRISQEGCGTEVIFPELGIEKPLPLNQPVAVRIRPEKPGTLSFSCGMNMLRGKVVVR